MGVPRRPPRCALLTFPLTGLTFASPEYLEASNSPQTSSKSMALRWGAKAVSTCRLALGAGLVTMQHAERALRKKC